MPSFLISIKSPTPDGDEYPDEKGNPHFNGQLRTREDAVPFVGTKEAAREEADRRAKRWSAMNDCHITQVVVEEVQ